MFLIAAPIGYIPAVRIPVAYAGGDGEAASEVPDALGDYGARSPGGTATATRRGTALRLPCTTRPMTAAEATAARAVLEDPAGIVCAGDWLELLTGGYLMPAYVGEVRQRMVSLAAGRHLVLSFDLLQAGEIDYQPPDEPGAWWRGQEQLYTDLAKTTPPLLGTDRVRAWEEDTGDFTLQQTSATAADAPFYSPAGLGAGLPSVNLNARPWMVSSEAGLVDPVSGTDVPWSAIMVATVPTDLAERYIISLQNIAVNNGLHALGVIDVAGVLRWKTLRRQDGTAFATILTGEPVVPGPTIITYVFDGTAVVVRANGQIVIEGALDVAGAATFHDLIFAALGVSGNNEWSGLGAEVVYFPGVAIRPVTQVQFGGLFQPYLDA